MKYLDNLKQREYAYDQKAADEFKLDSDPFNTAGCRRFIFLGIAIVAIILMVIFG
jgi:hypothetical protein